MDEQASKAELKRERTISAHMALAGLNVISILFMGWLGTVSDSDSATMFYFIAGMNALVLCVHIAIFKGAQQSRNGARISSMIVGLFMLPGFPIGTAIGVFLIYNAWNRWDAPEVASEPA